MKSAFVPVLGTLFATQTAAKWDACGFGDYKVIFNSLAQGVGVDPTRVDTDCVSKADALGKKSEQFFSSFENFSTNDWAAPLYVLAEVSTASTDVFTACQTTNLAKQFAVRMNSLGGLFDLFSTVGVAYLVEYVTKPGEKKSELFNAMDGFYKAESCQETSFNLAMTMQHLFSYQALPAYYAEQLPQDLVSEVLE